MKVLITGGAGFIGSHLARHWRSKHKIVIFDNLTSGLRKNIQDISCQLIQGDVRDVALLQKACRDCDLVVHLAALINAADSILKADEYLDVNIKGTFNVLQVAKQCEVKKVIFASSAAVYGDHSANPKNESMLPQPISPYAISKLTGENLCALYHQHFHLETVALRFFNIYGLGQRLNSSYAPVIPHFVESALQGRPLTIYGDGLQTRDFICIDDVMDAIDLVVPSRVDGVFNVGSGNATSIVELARKVIQTCNTNAVIQHQPARAGDVLHSQADITKIRGLGFRPKSPLESKLIQLRHSFSDALSITQ
ncbi:MAG: NAD-dependent epimerase/dehydratase family protein [Verrucomicrobiota bacterium]